MIFNGRTCCYKIVFVVSICYISCISADEDNSSKTETIKTTIGHNRAIELKRVDVPTSNDDGIFGDVFPQLQNVNAFIFEYRQGRRIMGDELLLWDSKSWKFPKQDVSLRIIYPENSAPSATKYYVTHFRLYISQDSKNSHGYLISGGSGQTNIDLKFVANHAKYMSFDVRIFGIQTDLIRNHTDVFGDMPDFWINQDSHQSEE